MYTPRDSYVHHLYPPPPPPLTSLSRFLCVIAQTQACYLCPCQSCGEGFYTSAAGAASCETCPAGYACTLPETATPTACTAGQYAPAGSDACEACPAGHYCPSPTMGAPTACADGFYNPATGEWGWRGRGGRWVFGCCEVGERGNREGEREEFNERYKERRDPGVKQSTLCPGVFYNCFIQPRFLPGPV
jgi:hypothetical protein